MQKDSQLELVPGPLIEFINFLQIIKRCNATLLRIVVKSHDIFEADAPFASEYIKGRMAIPPKIVTGIAEKLQDYFNTWIPDVTALSARSRL